jgi:ABC-2 type transport system ATP-binding protein
LVAAGAVDDVLAEDSQGLVIVRLNDLAAGLATLRAAGIESDLIDNAIHVRAVADPEIVSRTLAAADLFVTELRRAEADLETVFLKLTQDPAEEAVA